MTLLIPTQPKENPHERPDLGQSKRPYRHLTPHHTSGVVESAQSQPHKNSASCGLIFYKENMQKWIAMQSERLHFLLFPSHKRQFSLTGH